GQLVDDHPAERPFTIEGIGRKAEVINIVAAPKTYKSYLAMCILLCVATGRMLFNLFATRQSRVLLIDNELHPETLSHRIPKIARALGIGSEEWRDKLDILSLRGRGQDLHRLDQF